MNKTKVIELQAKIVKNSIYNTLGRVVFIISGFIITPYIITKIGIESYGIWALLFVFTGYFYLLDFGISGSYVKYIAEYNAKKDEASLKQVITSGFYFNLILGICLFCVGLLFKQWIFNLFFRNTQITPEINIVYSLALLTFSLSYVFGVFQGVIAGFQRMDILNNIAIIFKVASILLTILLLEMEYGLLGLVLSTSAGTLLTLLFNIIYSKKIFGGLNLSIRNISLLKFKKMVLFGVKLQVTNLAIWIEEGVPKLMLAYYAPINFVSFYDVSMKIIKYTKEIPTSFYGALIPASSELEAVSTTENVRSLYVKALKISQLIIFPLTTFIFINSEYIIDMWVGPEFSNSIFVLKVLSLGSLVHLTTGVGTAICRGIGKPEIEMKYSVVTSLLIITISLLLVHRYGLKGIAGAVAISLSISSIYFLKYFNKYLGIGNWEFFSTIVLKPMIVVPLFILTLSFLNSTEFDLGTTSRMKYFSTLIVEYLSFQVLFSVILHTINYVNLFPLMTLFKHKPALFPYEK